MNGYEQRAHKKATALLEEKTKAALAGVIEETNRGFQSTHELLRLTKGQLERADSDNLKACLTMVEDLKQTARDSFQELRFDIRNDEKDICRIGDHLHEHLALTFWGRLKWLFRGQR